MPIPAPGTYDVASQITLAALKAEMELTQKTALAPVRVNAAIGAATRVVISIAPPVGETWIVDITAGIEFAAGVTAVLVSAGVHVGAATTHGSVASYIPAGVVVPAVATDIICGVNARMTLTNTYIMRLVFDNAGAATNYGYSYSGVKI